MATTPAATRQAPPKPTWDPSASPAPRPLAAPDHPDTAHAAVRRDVPDRRHPAAVDHLPAGRAGAAAQGSELPFKIVDGRRPGHQRHLPELPEHGHQRRSSTRAISQLHRRTSASTPWTTCCSRSLLALLGLSSHRLRLRLRDGGPGALAARPDHPHRPPGGRLRPLPADRAGRPGRRAQGARRHLRRDAGPAGAGLHRPAAVRRERLARAAHPARDQPHAAGGAPLRSRGARGAPAARQDPAGHQRAQRAARRGPAAARPQRQPDRRAQAGRPRRGRLAGRRPGARRGRGEGRGDPRASARPRSSRATASCWSGSR